MLGRLRDDVARARAVGEIRDLGAGEGRIPIAAAKQFGARAVGIEYNPDIAELSRRNVLRAGVEAGPCLVERRRVRRR